MSAHEVMKAGEPTEMARVAEADTQAAYAWALDYDDPDEFPTQPTQRLTSRHITALGVAVSLVVIAVAGAVALIAASPKSPPEPVAAPPAAVLDGMYRYAHLHERHGHGRAAATAEGWRAQVPDGLACLSIRVHASRMYCYVDSVGRQESPDRLHAAVYGPMAFHRWPVAETAREVA